MERNIYRYEGPVLDKHGKVLADNIGNKHDNGTQAVSEAQARANIGYRWKKNHGYDPKAMHVELPGKIILVQ